MVEQMQHISRCTRLIHLQDTEAERVAVQVAEAVRVLVRVLALVQVAAEQDAALRRACPRG